MVADNKNLTATIVPANSQTNLYFTTANSDLSSLDIITGTDGYITTDDDATLELGSDFEIEQLGYVDTDAGSGKNLVYKETAFRTYISAEDEITSAITYGAIEFPVVEAVNGGNDVINQQNHTVNLPAGIVAGDLLIVVFTTDETPAVTFPGGWINLFDTINGVSVRFTAEYRIADGGEGASIVVTTADNQMTSHTSYRISGYNGVPEVGVSATGADNSPNPPNLTPSWGLRSTLWLSIAGYDGGTKTVNAYPANYTDGRNDRANNAEGSGTGSARREIGAVSDDPEVFTLSGVDDWVANTIAIAPAELEVTATGISSGEYTVNTSLNSISYDLATDYTANTTVAVSMGGGLIPVFLLEEQELTAAAASVTFSNIDTLVADWDSYAGVTSRHLVVVVNAASADAVAFREARVRFNGDAGGNYNGQYLYGQAGADLAFRATATDRIIPFTIPGTTYADAYGGGVMLIPHAFNTTNHKAGIGFGGAVEDNVWSVGFRWADTAAITSILLFTNAGDYATGSTFWLGVVDERYLVEEDLLAGVGTIDFATIPQDGSDLVVIGYGRGTLGAAEDELEIEFNGDGGGVTCFTQRLIGTDNVTSAAPAAPRPNNLWRS